VRWIALAGLVVVLSACGTSASSTNGTATVSASATESSQIAVGTPGSSASTPIPAATAPGSFNGPPLNGPAHVAGIYGDFLRGLCQALTSKNAGAVTFLLPHYQYNSGLRFGQLGDGEGQTGDPGLMNDWLSKSAVRCVLYTPEASGHGTLMTNGWNQPGGWSLIDLDTFNGKWKINDFTFGSQKPLYAAMHVAGPVIRHRD